MTISKRSLITVGLAMALSPWMAQAADKGDRGQLAAKDYKFVVDATQGGISEVQLGELAKQKSTNPQVKSFAEKMVTDHNKSNEDLKNVATKKGAVLPSNLPRKETSTMDDLQKASGADFDKAYVEHMLKDHKKDVKEFEDATKNLTDPDLRAFAEKTLPTLQEHLRMIQQLDATIKK